MLVENGGNHVEYPGKAASADYPNDTDDEIEAVLVCKSLDDTVDSPYDVKNGNAKNDLYDPGKLVDKLNEFFHCFAPLDY